VKFRFALRAVTLNRHDDGRTDQDAVFSLLSEHNAAFLDAEALAESGRNDDRAPLAHLQDSTVEPIL